MRRISWTRKNQFVWKNLLNLQKIKFLNSNKTLNIRHKTNIQHRQLANLLSPIISRSSKWEEQNFPDNVTHKREVQEDEKKVGKERFWAWTAIKLFWCNKAADHSNKYIKFLNHQFCGIHNESESLSEISGLPYAKTFQSCKNNWPLIQQVRDIFVGVYSPAM